MFVPLTKTEFDALRELARIERRRPQDQAATLLAEALVGAVSTPRPDHDTPTDQISRRTAREDQRVSAA